MLKIQHGFIFFLSGFSLVATDNSQDCRRRKWTILISLYHSTCSRTFRHLFTVFRPRWLPIFNCTACTRLLLDKFYPAVKIRTWLNINFHLFLDFMYDLIVMIFYRQAGDPNLHQPLSFYYKQNDQPSELPTLTLPPFLSKNRNKFKSFECLRLRLIQTNSFPMSSCIFLH